MTKTFFMIFTVVIVFSLLLFTVSNKTMYLIHSIKIVNLKFVSLGTSHHLFMITTMGREGGEHTVTIITGNKEGSLEH